MEATRDREVVRAALAERGAVGVREAPVAPAARTIGGNLAAVAAAATGDGSPEKTVRRARREHPAAVAPRAMVVQLAAMA